MTAASEPVNIATHLPGMAERYPDKPAIVLCTGRDNRGQTTCRHLTFRELDQEADRYAHGLERVGITRGTRTILMVRPGVEFFALTFALFKVGAVPVLIDPGMGAKQVARCLAPVRAEAFIGIPPAHVLRTMFRSAFRTVHVAVTVGRRWFWSGHRLADLRTDPWRRYEMAPTAPDEQAAILFTSGSTGPAKGVIYEHRMFDAQVHYLKSHFGYGPEEIDLPTFPLFALFDAALGMTAVIPEMDFSRPGSVDPRKIVSAIQDQRATHMFGSPALLDRVGRYGQANGVTLPSLKRVITAGAPVPPRTLECWHTILPPDGEVHTPYGASEALPVASIGSREMLSETREQTARGAGTCVGKPMAGLSVKIIEITDEPIADWSDRRVLPPGQIGEIVVQGPIVTRAYFENPQANALAKIADGDAFWHRMGDVGYFDDAGRLWFCGRKAHRVVTEHGTLFPVQCEAVFNQHPRVRRSALVGVGPLGQQHPVLWIELESGDRGHDRKQLTQELLTIGAANELTRSIHTILYHPSFPVDVRHNAKISREKLAEQLQ